jgi:hypothetical protein
MSERTRRKGPSRVYYHGLVVVRLLPSSSMIPSSGLGILKVGAPQSNRTILYPSQPAETPQNKTIKKQPISIQGPFNRGIGGLPGRSLGER